MTQDEIIELAKQAGFLTNKIKSYVISPYTFEDQDLYEEIEAFAKLVAEKEREACAQIAIYGCMVPPDGGSPTEDERLLCEHIAHSIRARGEA